MYYNSDLDADSTTLYSKSYLDTSMDVYGMSVMHRYGLNLSIYGWCPTFALATHGHQLVEKLRTTIYTSVHKSGVAEWRCGEKNHYESVFVSS